MGENYSISKKETRQEFVIERRWVTKAKTIHIPIRDKEIYFNGKKFGEKLSFRYPDGTVWTLETTAAPIVESF
ncbi:MAG: hypothetical protein ABI361_07575 [Nitrososphaera sp.]|jgi:hypothetical protein